LQCGYRAVIGGPLKVDRGHWRQNVDRHAVAAIMSDEAGIKIDAAEQAPEAWAATTTFPGTGREKGLLAKMFAYYDRHGFTGNSLALTTILGREPRRLRA
jgi:hypothetical protein